MTREEFDNIQPGTKMRIGDCFVEDPHDALIEYLGTVQVLERIEINSTGWIGLISKDYLSRSHSAR